MREMQTIVVSVPAHLSVRLSLCVMRFRCANTAGRIDVQLGVEALGDLRNIVLDGSPDLSTDSMRPLPNYYCHLFCF